MSEKHHETKFCSSCGKKIHKDAELCPKCGVRQAPTKGTKSLWVAIGLSFFIIGAGQVYLGQVGKGVLMFLVGVFFPFFVGGLIGGLSSFSSGVFAGIVLFVILWGYNVYDAYATAEKINSGEIKV
jgi:TM2 domain-containing membrane protein YozV